MNIPKWCVRYPVTTMVGVILALLFGGISLSRIPVQMKPTIDRPVITVETKYKGAAPLEVEEEVTEPTEQKLTSVEGLTKMTSKSEEGRSKVILEFDWGTDKDVARLDVSEKMGLVRDLPDDTDRPTIRAVNSDAEDSIAWIVINTSRPINEVRVVADNVIRPKLERVPGVGAVFMFGGEDREVRITLDYQAMNARGITVKALREALLRENQNTKGGKIDEGKRRYVIRTVGNFTQLDQLRNTIIDRLPAGLPPGQLAACLVAQSLNGAPSSQFFECSSVPIDLGLLLVGRQSRGGEQHQQGRNPASHGQHHTRGRGRMLRPPGVAHRTALSNTLSTLLRQESAPPGTETLGHQ